MACTTVTWRPSSPQLRLALNSSSFRKSPWVLARVRVGRQPDHEVRALCVAHSGKRRGIGATSNGSDPLSGWSSSDNGENPVESEKKSWFKGIVGAGVAGIVLVAGLTLAASSIGKRNLSRPKQQMEPLTVQQEISLLSADETPSDKIIVDGNERSDVKHEDGNVYDNSDMGQDHFPASEHDDAPGEKKISTAMEKPLPEGVRYASNGTNVIDNISSQEKLETAVVDVQANSETIIVKETLPETEVLIGPSAESTLKDLEGSLSASPAKPTSENQDSLLKVESSSSSYQETLDTKHPELFSLSNSNGISAADAYAASESVGVSISLSSQLDSTSDSCVLPANKVEAVPSVSIEESPDLNRTSQGSAERSISPLEVDRVNKIDSPETSVPTTAYPLKNELETDAQDEIGKSRSLFEIPIDGDRSPPTGIPAPSAAIMVNPGKILVPAAVDQVQGQAFAALQVLKVMEIDARPSDLCTRREYARWLVSASSALSRNTASKVYPAMYIENVSELAFDDITPEDPDFPSIQGLAEAGLITSKLSSRDLLKDVEGPFLFFPESLLSRQDLVSWKMALEKRQLPEADKQMLYKLSGFIDIDKINPDAWPALVADLSAGDQGITALAFGCTRLFQPNKPITKAQAAIALANGEASELVGEELARIEAESMAENAVSAHNDLVAEVEKDVNASFEKELSMEREKIDAVEKMAEQARSELELLRAQREEENLALLKERATIESGMEVLSRLQREVNEQLQSLMSDKAEISYEKERLNKLRKEAEDENQQISKLHYELEVERKALSMARAWAEDEAKRAKAQSRAVEEARKHWEMNGLKVVVDKDLREQTTSEVTWLNAGKQFSVEGTINRADELVDKLKVMANHVRGKSREVIDLIIQKIHIWVSALKEWAQKAGNKAVELTYAAGVKSKGSVEELKEGAAQFGLAVKDGVKRVAEDCREGVGKLTQKFKS